MELDKEDGTWLALSLKGKAAVILNLTKNEKNVKDLSRKSRGSLISNFVTSNDSIESYLSKLYEENINGQQYNPYCLLLLDLKYVKKFQLII